MNEVKNGSVTPKVIELAVVRERLHQPLDDLLVERERDRDPDREGEERDDQARAELVEVLDERDALAVR